MMDIIGKRRIWFLLSLALVAMGILAMVFNGVTKGTIMNFGIDFTGGSMLILRFEREVSIEEVREVLVQFGREESVIQRTGGNDIAIRTELLSSEERIKIMQAMREKFGKVELLEADTIGPVIGRELRIQALLALIVATIGITIYVSLRFEFKYAMAAILALYHDAIITAGIIALLWRNVETAFVAAILTIMGYSINDTIVIFDRIRENLGRPGAAKKKFAQLVNESVLQTMPRSINTVLTTIIIVTAVLLFGGATLRDFVLILLIGFAVGAYSSIFFASPLLVAWEKWGIGKK